MPTGGLIMIRSLIGLAILIADIWAILRVFQSNATDLQKILWTAVIIVFPLVGVLFWYLAGPGVKKI
jgi:hypothetical protein